MRSVHAQCSKPIWQPQAPPVTNRRRRISVSTLSGKTHRFFSTRYVISLSNRIAVITGASRGIGAATAIKLAQAGERGIVLNYNRDREEANSLAAEVKGAVSDA